MKIKVLSLDGGVGGKKRKGNDNPYEERTPEFPTTDDINKFEQAFGVCVEIGNSTALDPIALIANCDATALEGLKNHLTTGTSHHKVKIEEACDLLPFVQNLVKVENFISDCHSKYKKMMSSALWKMGTDQKGVFKMSTLCGVIDGAKAKSTN